TKHWLLFFTSKGKVYRVKVWDIPEGSRTARGMFAANLPNVVVSTDERVSAVMDLKEYSEGKFLVFATKKGMVKRTALIEYDSPRSGLVAINLKPGDELVEVLLTEEAARVGALGRGERQAQCEEAAPADESAVDGATEEREAPPGAKKAVAKKATTAKRTAVPKNSTAKRSAAPKRSKSGGTDR